MFDVNPNVFGNYLSLAVDENDNSINFDTALTASKYYYYELYEAKIDMRNIQEIVSSN